MDLIPSQQDVVGLLRQTEVRVVLFCDDLSFDGNDASYKSLKAALDGGVEGRPDNVVFYATSNRRHLLPRNMIENEQSTAKPLLDAIAVAGIKLDTGSHKTPMS